MEAPPSPFVISTGAQRSGEICGPAALPWECFSTGEVMGLRPTQGDEKYLLFGNHTRWKRRPPPLSSRPERSVVERSAVQRTFPGNVFRPEKSWAFGPPKVMKNTFCSATTLAGSAALPFVISTGAQRSGEICGVSGPSLEMSSRPEESWVVDPPKVMKNTFCSATTLAGSAALPFVISTGAQRSGEICGVSGPSLE